MRDSVVLGFPLGSYFLDGKGISGPPFFFSFLFLLFCFLLFVVGSQEISMFLDFASPLCFFLDTFCVFQIN